MTQAQRVFEAVMRGKGYDDFTKSPQLASIDPRIDMCIEAANCAIAKATGDTL